jgi:pimeloyl-ACP methyl ester carboxylesterase
MPVAAVNGIEIAYETWGDESDAAVLLLPGAGRQLVEWNRRFVDGIVSAGYRVIAIDQRDSGLSTHFTGAGKAALGAVRRPRRGETASRSPAYRLDDMAADGVGVLDSLGVGEAHLVGFSLGGAVAQQIAVHFPKRVRSLASIMASTGDPAVGRPDAAGARILVRALPATREQAIDEAVARRRLISTSGTFDEDAERRRMGRAFDRSFDPAGTGRQLAALWAAGDRTSQLAAITTPTLVIHGGADTLVDVSGGRATADAIPGARLLVLEAAGHNLDDEHHDVIVAALTDHFSAADSRDSPFRGNDPTT